MLKKKTRKKLQKMLSKHSAELIAGLIAGITTKLLDAAGSELALEDGGGKRHKKKRGKKGTLPHQMRALGGTVAHFIPSEAIISAIRSFSTKHHRSADTKGKGRKSSPKSARAKAPTLKEPEPVTS